MVTYLWDWSGKCSLLQYGSRKDNRVTKAIRAEELHAFSTAYDFAYVLQHDLLNIIGTCIRIDMFIDSKGLL